MIFRSIILSVIFTIAAFSIVSYTACKKDKCKDVVCENGGTCNTDDGSCICLTGFAGDHCETVTDPCAKIKCKNEGVCKDGKCACAIGFEGDLCEQLSVNKYFGTWIGTDMCTSSTYPADTMTISYSLASSKSIKISNPAGLGKGYSVTGELTATNVVTIPDQMIAAGINLSGIMTFGTGSLSNHMTFTYKQTGTNTDSCVGTYTR